MIMSMRCAVIISLLAGLVLVLPLSAASLDPKALDETINVSLRDSSMSDAVAMIASASDIRIVAPGEPDKGIIMLMNGQTVRQVLDALAVSSKMQWQVRDDMVVFTKTADSTEYGSGSAGTLDPLTPEQGMAEMIDSLNSSQLYALSAGYAMGYMDLTPVQRDIMTSMLSAPTVGVRETGEIVTGIPGPETSRVAIVTLPYLVVPDAAGTGTMSLRLDSTPYITLTRKAK